MTYSLAIEVGVAQEGAPRTGEGEHGKRHRDWDVDSDLQIGATIQLV